MKTFWHTFTGVLIFIWKDIIREACKGLCPFIVGGVLGFAALLWLVFR